MRRTHESVATPRVGPTAARALALGGLVVAGMSTATLDAQQDFSDVEMVATHVAGNVYMLEGRGGNIGVSAGPDGALIVDDQFAPLADKIRVALAGLLDEEIELEFVLNTHWHGDHTGGNVEFGPEATIVAHDNVRKRLAEVDEFRGQPRTPTPAEGLPVITFAQSVSIHFNGEEIRSIHLPSGHTDGDAIVHFTGSNVVHMGDDFFAGRFPFVDLESGGSVHGLIQAIDRVLEVIPSDARIIPGHGPLSTVADLRAYHRMLSETTAVVKRQMDEGKTFEEIQAGGLGAGWAEWGTGFINEPAWINTIFQSLTAEGGGD